MAKAAVRRPSDSVAWELILCDTYTVSRSVGTSHDVARKSRAEGFEGKYPLQLSLSIMTKIDLAVSPQDDCYTSQDKPWTSSTLQYESVWGVAFPFSPHTCARKSPPKSGRKSAKSPDPSPASPDFDAPWEAMC